MDLHGRGLTKQEQGAILDEQVDAAMAELAFQMGQGHTHAYLDVLDWFARFHKYSIGNCLLIKRQRPDAQLCAGYQRWQELGFSVRKGERGIAIRAPWRTKAIDAETGEVVERLLGYYPTYVWDIVQTNEYPAKQPPTIYTPVPGDWAELYDHIKTFVLCQGVFVHHGPLPPGIHGLYRQDHISINEALPAVHQIGTLVHEWVHHLCRETDRAQSVQERELIAESVAYTVCRVIGIELATARDYLLSYRLTDEDLGQVVNDVQRLAKQSLQVLHLRQETHAKGREPATEQAS